MNNKLQGKKTIISYSALVVIIPHIKGIETQFFYYNIINIQKW